MTGTHIMIGAADSLVSYLFAAVSDFFRLSQTIKRTGVRVIVEWSGYLNRLSGIL